MTMSLQEQLVAFVQAVGVDIKSIHNEEAPVASVEQAGDVRLATVAEAQAGTATNIAVTPAGLAAALPYIFGIVDSEDDIPVPAPAFPLFYVQLEP